jgi:hypothetical protein
VSQVLLNLEFPVSHRGYPAACSTYSDDDAWYPHAMAAATCNSAAPYSTGKADYALMFNRI